MRRRHCGYAECAYCSPLIGVKLDRCSRSSVGFMEGRYSHMTDLLSSASTNRSSRLLSQARSLCEPVLREAIASLPGPLDRMAAYHFGWCDPSGNTICAGWGKGLRAALVFGSATACGARTETAVPVAAAIELAHNFTLVHDDVMDEDRLRRGRATVWSVWGVPQAICLGDALHALAIRMLSVSSPRLSDVAIVHKLESALVQVCRGQSQDCAFEAQTHVSIDDYLEMAQSKTGALTACAAALGALCAGADPLTVSRFENFGLELGLAFQVIDDILGIWGDPATTGKPARGDLIRRKRSFPVVAALASETAAAAELANLYRSTAPITATDAAHAADAIHTAGGREAAYRYAYQRGCFAVSALPDLAGAQDLVSLAHFAIDRCR